MERTEAKRREASASRGEKSHVDDIERIEERVEGEGVFLSITSVLRGTGREDFRRRERDRRKLESRAPVCLSSSFLLPQDLSMVWRIRSV